MFTFYHDDEIELHLHLTNKHECLVKDSLRK